MGIKVLVVGSGAREHALVRALMKSPDAETIFAAPGNDGMELPVQRLDIGEDDVQSLFRSAVEEHVGLVIVGPRRPLALGLADLLRGAGIAVLGPGREAARLEDSRAFAKDFAVRHGIASPRHRVAASPGDIAISLAALGERVTIKPDGISTAATILCDSRDEAESRARALLRASGREPAPARLVLEERLAGASCVLYAFCDGVHLLPFPVLRAQEALSAYAPIELGDEDIEALERDILRPFLSGLHEEALDFRGVIGFELLFTEQGPRLLDFQTGLGDPAAQTLLAGLKTDLLQAAFAAANARLEEQTLEWNGRHVFSVVLACDGQTGAEGRPVAGLDSPPAGVEIHYGGVEKSAQGWLARPGGRAFTVTAAAATLDEARAAAGAAAGAIQFEGRRFSGDAASTGPKAEEPVPPRTPAAVWIFLSDEADRAVLEKAARVLSSFGVASRVSVVSAYPGSESLRRELGRTESEAKLYIVAAKGGDPLTALISARTVKPVIGVPLSTALSGVDSLLTMVQAPPGFPTATVAVDGAENAAYLALRILALSDPGLAAALARRRSETDPEKAAHE